MRVAVIILGLLFQVFLAHSQMPNKFIDKFMGLKFASSKQQVVNLAKLKKGIYAKGSSSQNTLSYSNMTFSGKPAFRVAFTFVENKLYEGRIFFKVDHKQKILNQYAEILSGIEEVYGESETNERKYEYPYSDGDVDAWVAISNNYATISDTWIDRVTPSAIKLFILDDGDLICLWYQQSDLQETASKASTLKSDY